jgi:hypothetical protein
MRSELHGAIYTLDRTHTRTHLPTTLQVLLLGEFLRVGLPLRHAKSSRDSVEDLNNAVCETAKWLKSSIRTFVK